MRSSSINLNYGNNPLAALFAVLNIFFRLIARCVAGLQNILPQVNLYADWVIRKHTAKIYTISMASESCVNALKIRR